MPKILTRLVAQLKKKGYSEEAAHRIAVSSLQKTGNLKEGSTEATAKGKRRGNMTPGERAKERASRYSKKKHQASDYSYDSKTNQAKLKKNRKRS